MHDTGVDSNPDRREDDDLDPQEYANAIAALLWQAADHRSTAARLRMEAADETAEAARHVAAAGECQKAAALLETGQVQGFSDGVLAESVSVDLLRSMVETQRAAANHARCRGLELRQEAESYDQLVAALERDATTLGDQPRGADMRQLTGAD